MRGKPRQVGGVFLRMVVRGGDAALGGDGGKSVSSGAVLARRHERARTAADRRGVVDLGEGVRRLGRGRLLRNAHHAGDAREDAAVVLPFPPRLHGNGGAARVRRVGGREVRAASGASAARRPLQRATSSSIFRPTAELLQEL